MNPDRVHLPVRPDLLEVAVVLPPGSVLMEVPLRKLIRVLAADFETPVNEELESIPKGLNCLLVLLRLLVVDA